MSDTLTLRLLRFLPRNLISRCFGWIAARERPQLLVRPFMAWFRDRFQLDLNEAAKPFEDYPSLLAMFTRELKPGARHVDGNTSGLVSPVDGKVGCFGRIEGGQLVQAKGMTYSLVALLGDTEAAEPFLNGSFATVYLSPRDYHRMHAPCSGAIARSLYEPGTLWPVNGPAVRNIPSLFAVNERVTTWITTERGPVALIMVGATNVGSIRLSYTEFVSNRGGQRSEMEHEGGIPVRAGDHVGTFELGSTIILLVADGSFTWTGLREGANLRMGQAIGRHA